MSQNYERGRKIRAVLGPEMGENRVVTGFLRGLNLLKEERFSGLRWKLFRVKEKRLSEKVEKEEAVSG